MMQNITQVEWLETFDVIALAGIPIRYVGNNVWHIECFGNNGIAIVDCEHNVVEAGGRGHAVDIDPLATLYHISDKLRSQREFRDIRDSTEHGTEDPRWRNISAHISANYNQNKSTGN
jgi:hypothetical protein